MRPVLPLTFLTVLLAAALTPAQVTCKPGEEGELFGSQASAGDRFGANLSRSGNTLVVGAEAAELVYVFERGAGTPANWTEVKVLAGPQPDSDFGQAVAVFGDTLVVGAPRGGALGEVYVHERDEGGPGQWGLVRTLAPSSGDFASYGVSLALDASTLLVGAPYDLLGGSVGAGQVHFYERDEGGANQWGWTATEQAPVAHVWGRFGLALAVEGTTAAIGEPWTLGPGAVFVYDRGPGGWARARELASGLADVDDFGEAVALQGDELAIGASQAGGGTVYVHERDSGGPGNWGLGATAQPPTFGGNFGTEVEFDGDVLAVSAPHRHNPAFSGRTILFGRGFAGQPWGFMSRFKAGTVGPQDHFSRGLSLEAGELIAGTSRSTLQGAGSVYFYDGVPEFPYPYCTAGKTTNGCAARLCSTGSPSATAATGFVVSAENVEGDKLGLLYFGANGQQATAWGNGGSFQCVVPPVVRAGLTSSGGIAGTCSGTFSFDLNQLWTQQPHKRPTAGTVVQAQLWFRDPGNTSNQSTSLSDALRFPVAP